MKNMILKRSLFDFKTKKNVFFYLLVSTCLTFVVYILVNYALSWVHEPSHAVAVILTGDIVVEIKVGILRGGQITWICTNPESVPLVYLSRSLGAIAFSACLLYLLCFAG